MTRRAGAVAGLGAILAACWLVPVSATAAPGPACGSGAHGSRGYAYAGYESARVAGGIRATVTALRPPSVEAGHAAAWIGVGGPSAGPKGESAWLQVGLAALPRAPAMLYAEITRPGREPRFVPLVENVAVGERHRLVVAEVRGRPGVWRVWVDGRPATEPIALRGSHGRWKPMATAETWNGGTASCNRFGFRFERVATLRAAGGAWGAFEPGFRFRDRGYVVRPLRPAPKMRRTVASDAAEAYAFDAASD